MSNENVLKLTDTIDEEEGIDLLELARELLHKAWIMIVCLIVGASAAGFFTASFVTPLYESTSMIYIYSKTTSITSLTDLQMSNQLAVDFQIVATTREVIEKVIQDLELPYTYEKMLPQVSITNPSGSHMLKITSTNPDPVQAANISNALADELRMRIADVMNTDEPSVVERAVVPEKPASPSVVKNAAIGGLVCAFLAAAVIIIAYMLDDTIKNDQDVRRYLNLNTLAAIPQDRSSAKKETADGKNAKIKKASGK